MPFDIALIGASPPPPGVPFRSIRGQRKRTASEEFALLQEALRAGAPIAVCVAAAKRFNAARQSENFTYAGHSGDPESWGLTRVLMSLGTNGQPIAPIGVVEAVGNSNMSRMTAPFRGTNSTRDFYALGLEGVPEPLVVYPPFLVTVSAQVGPPVW